MKICSRRLEREESQLTVFHEIKETLQEKGWSSQGAGVLHGKSCLVVTFWRVIHRKAGHDYEEYYNTLFTACLTIDPCDDNVLNIASWNDWPGRTLDQVNRALDEANNILRERGILQKSV